MYNVRQSEPLNPQTPKPVPNRTRRRLHSREREKNPQDTYTQDLENPTNQVQQNPPKAKDEGAGEPNQPRRGRWGK